jgi:5-methylcytosine-specific restriction endonuclease McrA
LPQPNPTRRVALPKPVQLSIFRRDGWLCRWCAKPVVFGPAMKLLETEVRAAGNSASLAYYHAHWTRATAPLLDELGAVLDHVKAFSAGGECAEENLVTACAKCNGRKSAAPLENWDQRVIRKPIKGKYGEPQAWDGLSSVFVMLAERPASKLTPGERDWLKALRMPIPDFGNAVGGHLNR